MRSLKFLMLASLACAPLAAHAEEKLSVCIDSASTTAARDEALAARIAKAEGVTLSVEHFDSSDDDDGMSIKEFKKLLDARCELLMGYPVDHMDSAAPPGLMATKPYDQTGFVLVEQSGSPAGDLAALPQGTQVGVTWQTMPNLYFLHHPNVTPDVYGNDAATLKALTDGKVKAAMVWKSTVDTYLAKFPGKLDIHPLDEPHARWDVVVLYAPRAASEAARFELQLAATKHAEAEPVVTPDGFDPTMIRRVGLDNAVSGAPPALYTKAQADDGMAKFSAYCAVCHGADLQGLAGPSLKGKNFASEKADFSISDVFTIVSQNMPATNPGSLEHDDYVQIMAYLLKENGYPAGSTALTFDAASQSKVPLLYHGK